MIEEKYQKTKALVNVINEYLIVNEVEIDVAMSALFHCLVNGANILELTKEQYMQRCELYCHEIKND